MERFDVEELTRYLLKMSDFSSFEDKGRVSENMGGDIRLPAEDRLCN
jgi:hypothetical protein